MQLTLVRSLGQEDPPEKEMATHSNILAWEIPWTVEPDRLPSMSSQELDTAYLLKQQTTNHKISQDTGLSVIKIGTVLEKLG